jgi:hypothetical protein
MDPFDRFRFERRKININAILAFVVAIVVAYVVNALMFTDRYPGGGGIFTGLIVVAVGGLWYHIRRVV